MPFPLLVPLVIAGGVLATGAVAGLIYKNGTRSSSTNASDKAASPMPPRSLGSFAVWGRPNSGKTTFIYQLLESPIPSEKIGTLSKIIHTKIPEKQAPGMPGKFKVEKIIDMPGTEDRLNDWLDAAANHDHVFYMIDLSRKDYEGYQAAIRSDIKATVERINSTKNLKRINFIVSHIDESIYKNVKQSEVGNTIQEDSFIRQIRELTGNRNVAGYIYPAILTNKESFEQMLSAIILDIQDA